MPPYAPSPSDAPRPTGTAPTPPVSLGSAGTPGSSATPATGAPTPSADTLLLLDPDTAPLDQLEAAVCTWAGRLAAATCHWLGLLAAFDRRKAWAGIGIHTCAHWLSQRCGLGLRTAQDHLRTAHALTHLPALRAAFTAGELSYSKVRAVTRVAEPDTEHIWLTHARATTGSELERLTTAYRHHRANPTRQHQARRLTFRTDDDGMVHLTAVLPAADAALLFTALDTIHTQLTTSAAADEPADEAGSDTIPPDHTAPPDGPAPGPLTTLRDQQRDADALVALAETALHHRPPRLLDPAHAITAHIDTSALVPLTLSSVLGPSIGLPAATLDRLACDARLRPLLTDADHNPLHLGRTRRHPTPHLRTAVYLRDHGTCQYPGCSHTHWLHVHHCQPWTSTGETTIENLTLSLRHRPCDHVPHRAGGPSIRRRSIFCRSVSRGARASSRAT
jgi:hypothetical protein